MVIKGGERPMGTATYGGVGGRDRARASPSSQWTPSATESTILWRHAPPPPLPHTLGTVICLVGLVTRAEALDRTFCCIL